MKVLLSLFLNSLDGFSIHQNDSKNILESNWIIFSHYKFNSGIVFEVPHTEVLKLVSYYIIYDF